MARLRLTYAADADIIDILAWSEAQFGEAARTRYQRLIAQALRDIAEDPLRPGSQARPELGDRIRSWHLRSSRRRAAERQGPVLRPRHFMIYRVDGLSLVIVGRILHDAMELWRHIQGLDWNEP